MKEQPKRFEYLILDKIIGISHSLSPATSIIISIFPSIIIIILLIFSLWKIGNKRIFAAGKIQNRIQ